MTCWYTSHRDCYRGVFYGTGYEGTLDSHSCVRLAGRINYALGVQSWLLRSNVLPLLDTKSMVVHHGKLIQGRNIASEHMHPLNYGPGPCHCLHQ